MGRTPAGLAPRSNLLISTSCPRSGGGSEAAGIVWGRVCAGAGCLDACSLGTPVVASAVASVFVSLLVSLFTFFASGCFVSSPCLRFHPSLLCFFLGASWNSGATRSRSSLTQSPGPDLEPCGAIVTGGSTSVRSPPKTSSSSSDSSYAWRWASLTRASISSTSSLYKLSAMMSDEGSR
jgi:hypothetical protein